MTTEVARFFRAVIFFAAGSLSVIVAVLTLRYTYVSILGENLYWMPELQMERMEELFSRKPVSDAKLLIFGDSTATFSLAAKRLPNAESLATINSTSMEAYYTLKRVLDSGGKPSCVLFSASFSWGANHDYFWPMFMGRGFYSDSDLDEIYQTTSAAKDPPGRSGKWIFEAKRFLYGKGILDGYTVSQFQEHLLTAFSQGSRVGGFRAFMHREKGSNPISDHDVFQGRTELTFAEEPNLNSSEKEYFRRFAQLLADRKIPLYVLEIPFADSVPASYSRAFREKFDSQLEAARPERAEPFHTITPPPLPAARYLSAGHLDLEGGKLLEPYVRDALKGCF